MNPRPYVPLLVKVLGWLLLHLLILALAFIAFIGWQLGLGLDSLLSGSAGERLTSFGNAARDEILYRPRAEWNEVVASLAREKKVTAAIVDREHAGSFPVPFRIPDNVLRRSKTALPPLPGPAGRRRPPPPSGAGGFDRDRGFPENGVRPASDDFEGRLPPTRPLFLLRGDQGDGYWAGVQLSLPGPPGRPHRHQLLLIRADGLDGSGMFFEFKPWLWGGLTVLALSVAFWTPFVWGITRYLRRLTTATDRIAAGQFQLSLPRRGNDELGKLGQAIESMSARLDHLISGQKRFLADAAHELCAPLARLRTGLGILEQKLGETAQHDMASIEADALELATLVGEILAFSRAGNRVSNHQSVLLEPLLREVVSREGTGNLLEMSIPGELKVSADPTLLARALGNLIRNAKLHGGSNAMILVEGVETADLVELTVTDDGPGVSPDEIQRLFEPFYRPDRSRSRETGGSGLGLAIVRTAVEACGGDVAISLPPSGGFRVTIRLPKPDPSDK